MSNSVKILFFIKNISLAFPTGSETIAIKIFIPFVALGRQPALSSQNTNMGVRFALVVSLNRTPCNFTYSIKKLGLHHFHVPHLSNDSVETSGFLRFYVRNRSSTSN